MLEPSERSARPRNRSARAKVGTLRAFTRSPIRSSARAADVDATTTEVSPTDVAGGGRRPPFAANRVSREPRPLIMPLK